MKVEINNPILPGFHPDPCALCVGDDYYIATSTFEWFPGVRIYHSKDLVTWDLVSMPLDSFELLDMRGIEASDGIWAPCFSFSDGIFYLIYTVVHSSHQYPFKDTPNYVTTAKDIKGPWTKPRYLNSSGFDPSLFHDKDGTKWLINMEWDYRKNEGGSQFTGILLQEYKDGNLIGEAKNIFKGTLRSFTEGPHLYYHNGYYYLLCAEGGTAYKHAVTLARSKELMGPYEVHPKNPILTSWEGKMIKDAPYDERTFWSDIGSSRLKKAGHASLCKGRDGRWYLFHLCARPLPGSRFCVLGRETAMQEVEWKEDGWLYLKEGGNHPYDKVVIETPKDKKESELKQVNNNEKNIDWVNRDIIYTFGDEAFRNDFQTLRIPYDSKYMSIQARKGYLRLVGRESIVSRYYQTLLARRQTDFTFWASTVFEFHPTSFQHLAGLIYRYDEENQYYLFISYDEERMTQTITSAAVRAGDYKIMVQQEMNENVHELGIAVRESRAQFFYKQKGCKYHLGKDFDITNLSDDFTYGFTGAFIGICVQDLRNQSVYADFQSFRYSTNMDKMMET